MDLPAGSNQLAPCVSSTLGGHVPRQVAAMTSRGEYAPRAQVQGTTKIAAGPNHRRSGHGRRKTLVRRRGLGVGRVVLATLLAEAPDALQRRDYHALRCLSGVALITKHSGKSRIVLMRQAVHVRLRNSVYHWARVAVQHDPRSRAKYTALRARGHGHGRALRSVADRLIAVACTMLRNQKTFDPALAQPTA